MHAVSGRHLPSFPRSGIVHPVSSWHIQSSNRQTTDNRLRRMFSRDVQPFPRSVSMHPMFSRQVLCGEGAYCAQRRLSERVVLERGRERCDLHCLSRGNVQPFIRSVSMHPMFSRDVQSFPSKHISGRMRRLLSRDLQPFHRSVSMRPMFSRQVLCGDGAYCAQRRVSERVVLERGRERCDVHCLSRGDPQSFPRKHIIRRMHVVWDRHLQPCRTVSMYPLFSRYIQSFHR